MRTRALALFALGLVGCDPGWHYRPLRAQAGDSEHARIGIESEGLSGSVDGQLFAGGLSIRVNLENLQDEAVTVDPARFAVLDAKGNALTTRTFVSSSCQKRATPTVIARGQACEFFAQYTVTPLRSFWRLNRDMKHLTVRIEGVKRGAVSIPVSADLLWSL